jgi:hypothetical protein
MQPGSRTDRPIAVTRKAQDGGRGRPDSSGNVADRRSLKINKRGHHSGLPADWEPSKKGRALCERPSLGRKSDHGSSGEAVLDALVGNFGSGVRTSRDD